MFKLLCIFGQLTRIILVNIDLRFDKMFIKNLYLPSAFAIDVSHLVNVLPNVASFDMVDMEGFTHFDFALAIDVDKVLYSKVLEQIIAYDK